MASDRAEKRDPYHGLKACRRGVMEFPRLEAWDLYAADRAAARVSRPLKEKVAIDGATLLEDITLTRVTGGSCCRRRGRSRLSMNAREWLASLSGSGDEKIC